MSNILITGANGQLGNEIKFLSFQYKNFNFIYTDVEELDISSYSKVERYFFNTQIDLIINCAAYTAVDKAEKEIDKAKRINSIGPLNLRLIAQKNKIPLIHISTDYVFDGRNYRPYKENDLTNPKTIYGKTKLEGEKNVLDYEKSIVIRTSWLYSTFGQNFVKTILKIAKENDTIRVVFDQIGSPTYAANLAETIVKISQEILSQNKNIIYGLYHYSNEGVCSWYDFAKEIIDYKKIECHIDAVKSEEFPRPAERPFYSVLDKSKIKQNFKISVPHWKDSLKQCLEKI
jgi:dTDP-4-dehydrorhamnose reductase